MLSLILTLCLIDTEAGSRATAAEPIEDIKSNILYHKTFACPSNVTDPITRSHYINYCYFMKAIQTCTPNNEYISLFDALPLHFTFKNCTGNQCKLIFNFEESVCLTRETGSNWKDPKNYMELLCTRESAMQIPVLDGDDVYCHWPTPPGAYLVRSNECIDGYAHIGYSLYLNTTVSNEPFDCIVAGNFIF